MRNNPQNPKETRSRTAPEGGFCMRTTYSVLKKSRTLDVLPPSKVNDLQLPFPSPCRILGKLTQEHLIFSPDVLITEGPHMCTHSWIFLGFFYRLQSSNCFFTLCFVAAAGRCSAKAAKAGPGGRGPGPGRLPKVALSNPGCCMASVPEACLATKRKQTTAR